MYVYGVLILLVTVNNSLRRATPYVDSYAAANPALWKLLRVICVNTSPSD